MEECVSPQSYPATVVPEFLILAILTSMMCNRRAGLMNISVMTKDVDHLFMCLLAIKYSSAEIFCLSLYPIFLVLFYSLESIFLSSLHILYIITSPLEVGWVNIFFQSVSCCIVLLTVTFVLQNLCNFMWSHMLKPYVDFRA